MSCSDCGDEWAGCSDGAIWEIHECGDEVYVVYCSTVFELSGGGGGGAVDSVNGLTGAVVLDQDDVLDGTTYKQYSATEKTKLAGIAAGAEVNVNADWNAVSGDAQILNKPTIPSVVNLFDKTVDDTDDIAEGATNKFISSTQKTDLTDAGDTTLHFHATDRARANHTGTQAISTITNLQTSLDAKVDENASIVAATKTKITYDAKGLVTGGADATTADIADSTNKRYVTDANLTVIGNTSGTNTGDQDLSGLVPNTRTVNGHALSSNVTVTKGDVGLGSVDDTSDATKNSAIAVLTNKTLISTTNVTEEITSTVSSATPTPTGGSLRNAFDVTALAVDAAFAAPSGTPVHRNKLWVTIKDDGTARALTWDAVYVAGGFPLPSTTVSGKILNLGFMYNTNNALNKWQLVAVAQEA